VAVAEVPVAVVPATLPVAVTDVVVLLLPEQAVDE
jgi:hypothetical protein